MPTKFTRKMNLNNQREKSLFILIKYIPQVRKIVVNPQRNMLQRYGLWLWMKISTTKPNQESWEDYIFNTGLLNTRKSHSQLSHRRNWLMKGKQIMFSAVWRIQRHVSTWHRWIHSIRRISKKAGNISIIYAYLWKFSISNHFTLHHSVLVRSNQMCLVSILLLLLLLIWPQFLNLCQKL